MEEGLFCDTEFMPRANAIARFLRFEVLLLQLLRGLLNHPQKVGLPVGLLTCVAQPKPARVLVGMHEAPGADWTLSTMAERAGMSRQALAAAFKRFVGDRLADYLALWRMPQRAHGCRRSTEAPAAMLV